FVAPDQQQAAGQYQGKKGKERSNSKDLFHDFGFLFDQMIWYKGGVARKASPVQLLAGFRWRIRAAKRPEQPKSFVSG
ncbi:MAG: hypothetical protein KDC41_19320, partial [Saprospiraceae bacterium]|nr:hypothetical protein [Saprospiraceae bacterium]